LKGNMLGTKENPLSSTQNLKEKKIKALWVGAEPSHWLAAWNFYFQSCWSPFLACANTPIINWGLFILLEFFYPWKVPMSLSFSEIVTQKINKFRFDSWRFFCSFFFYFVRLKSWPKVSKNRKIIWIYTRTFCSLKIHQNISGKKKF
jgi:hypothetical protein